MRKSEALRKVEEVISHLSYKPGWAIYATEPPREEWERFWIGQYARIDIHIGMVVKSLKDCGATSVNLSFSRQYEQKYLEGMPTAGIVDLIMYLLRECEEHEMREWFKFDGMCVIDPHPERKSFESAQTGKT